jgi:ketosteroid isomerase-like protein
MPQRPTSPEAQLQWLVDRAEIAELLVEYARCIDRRDWAGLQETYTVDGVMDHGAVAVGRDRVPELSEKILRDCAASHHVVDSPSIVIEGDTAHIHAHYLATHLAEGNPPAIKRQGGGWYDCTLRRTDRGWRFTRVRATSGFRTGEELRLA